MRLKRRSFLFPYAWSGIRNVCPALLAIPGKNTEERHFMAPLRGVVFSARNR